MGTLKCDIPLFLNKTWLLNSTAPDSTAAAQEVQALNKWSVDACSPHRLSRTARISGWAYCAYIGVGDAVFSFVKWTCDSEPCKARYAGRARSAVPEPVISRRVLTTPAVPHGPHIGHFCVWNKCLILNHQNLRLVLSNALVRWLVNTVSIAWVTTLVGWLNWMSTDIGNVSNKVSIDVSRVGSAWVWALLWWVLH